ncbi:Zinc finger, BED-type [Sesbania bispinosa]|nr:Zinc finger, BED-type [Sesbania bispinosa]
MEGDINVVRLDIEDDNLGLEPEECCETVEACNNKKRPKLLTSQCWKFFTKIGLKDDGNEKAKCDGCGQEYKIGGTYGTSHLHRHIDRSNGGT